MTAKVRPTLSEIAARVTVEALHEKRMETDRYLRGATFQPCHPDCQHCKPRAAHYEEIQSGLQQRRDAILEALTALGDGPCTCGLRKGEHWNGDHK